MARAIELAARARGRTSPNPMVGAVLVRGDAILGEGFHARAGESHAEAIALAQAGSAARRRAKPRPSTFGFGSRMAANTRATPA